MAHVKVVDRREGGTPTPITSDAKVKAHSGGAISDIFFAMVYVDDVFVFFIYIYIYFFFFYYLPSDNVQGVIHSK